MLLKLIPAHSEPTIHFSFVFTDLPPNANTPSSWSNQLSHLIVEDLEVPTTVHSFDKAAGLTSLLEEVAFDVERGEVRCRFVDGGVEEWGFFRFCGMESGANNGYESGHREGQKLMAALETIIRDVKDSTCEDERAALERERERQKIAGVERSKSMGFRSHPKSPKHKKQRSVFMQLVSSIGSSLANLTSSSLGPTLPSHRFSTSLSMSSSYPAHSSNGSQIPPPHLPGTSPRARALRRAARSGLVDAFRRFVITELTRRLLAFSYNDASGQYTGVHGGGFCVWILHSMRRRAQERIEQLLEEAETLMAEKAKERGLTLTPLTIPDGRMIQWAPEPGRPSEDAKTGFEATTMNVPLSFSDDEDDTETETDGSSVHTPSSSSHMAYFPARPATSASSHSQGSLSSYRFNKELDSPPLTPTTPSPPSSPTTPTSFQYEDLTPTRPVLQSRPTTLSQNLSGSALYEYTTLTDLRERLWQLAMFAESQARITSDEIRNRLEILAVRSKRRAWSCGVLKQSTGGGLGQYGLAMPFQSSPLARFSWTAEDVRKDQEKMDALAAQNGVVVSTMVSVESFPVFGGPETDELFFNDVPLEAQPSQTQVEREFELYEEFPGPSPLDTRGGSRRRRNHVRGKDPAEFGITATHGIGRLFPVSEELEGEGEEAVDMEFRVALGGSSRYGAMRGKRKDRSLSTFMGCDEVAVESEGEDNTAAGPQFIVPETLLDDDDALEDPRDIDVELGFGGFDFHQHANGNDFIVHGDEEDLFSEDEDEDEFKFDMSAHLERPKIRPRIRTSSIFVPKKESPDMSNASNSILCQPINFAASTSPPKYSTLSKSAPSTFPPRRARSPPLPSSRRTENIRMGSEIYRPELEIDVNAAREYDVTGFGRLGDMNTSTIDLKSPTKPLPSIPILDLEAQEEEFTLAMDLPRSIGGLRGAGGRKKSKFSASASALGLGHPRPSLSSLFEESQAPIAC
ncbi:hypothetical protein CPB83DRAFT_838247 [Crepidotus variabilis]|uniref:Uncharacterized protein n=1 Tax=Crepidotus variabilis TaxID=179855 RepID=A0A9P6E9J1_9AGAR|nr:hypothetical protein CPB83DRAFT_838247 [Crepidotus variabilis]